MSSTSLSEIARAANVSTATVSRALRGLPGVSPDKREEINAIVEQLGKPVRQRNRKGSGDSMERGNLSNGIVCVLQTGDGYLFATDLFVRQMRGITRCARFHRLDTVVGFGNNLSEAPLCVQEKRVVGVLVHGQELADELAEHLEGVPMVWAASHAKLPASRVMQGNDESGQLAAQYLIDRGYRRIACLYPFRHQVMESRLHAFELKVKQQGGEVVWIGKGEQPMPANPNDFSEFANLLDPLVDELLALPDLPQGVFIPDDSITAHIYPILKRRNVAIGKAMEIISFGNKPSYLAGLDPRPASIDIAPEMFGEQLVETLIWHIRHPREKRRVRVHIEPFVVRH